jgi:hypothetical protein
MRKALCRNDFCADLMLTTQNIWQEMPVVIGSMRFCAIRVMTAAQRVPDTPAQPRTQIVRAQMQEVPVPQR